MKISKGILFIIVILFMASFLFAEAQDHPALYRYEGAEIVADQQQDYARYVLGLANHEERNFRGHMKYFADYIDLEGKLTRIQYCVDPSEGLEKVFQNYMQALKKSGYQILFTTSEMNNWPFWHEDVYHHEWGINALQGEDFRSMSAREGYRFLTAKGVYKANDLYFAIYMNIDKDDVHGDCLLVTQDIIEINPMESGLVTAQKIDEAMALSGFVSIYGVHFDSGECEIQDESGPALEEIAIFLKKNSEKKYYIVGHTDNVGDFNLNMELSEKRAKAVKRELIEQYGVRNNQLNAYGVGPLCPVTSNRSDVGKARNRRVEIVVQ